MQLKPAKKYPLGHVQGVNEGKLYGRTYLMEKLAFGSPQGGVSGEMSVGCNAIVVSKGEASLDTLDSFNYLATGGQGSGCMRVSLIKNRLIRVFHTSNNEGDCRPGQRLELSKTDKVYSYDGLYKIVSCNEVRPSKGLCEFALKRVPGRPQQYKELGNAKVFNELTLAGLKQAIEDGEIWDVEGQLPPGRAAKCSNPPASKKGTRSSAPKKATKRPAPTQRSGMWSFFGSISGS
jgi:hypothetical protein